MNALVFHKIEPLANVTKYILVCNNLTQSKPSHMQSRYYFSDPLPLWKITTYIKNLKDILL